MNKSWLLDEQNLNFELKAPINSSLRDSLAYFRLMSDLSGNILSGQLSVNYDVKIFWSLSFENYEFKA